MLENTQRRDTDMSFLLADHDRSLEVDVDNNKQLVVARLEEQVLDVTEENICEMLIRRNWQDVTAGGVPIFWEPIGDW